MFLFRTLLILLAVFEESAETRQNSGGGEIGSEASLQYEENN